MVDLSQGGTIDMIKRDTISDILYELRDGKCHTYAELAEAAEVSLITVRRCIESLSYHHPIVIFQGQRSDGRNGLLTCKKNKKQIKKILLLSII
jgi:response regulator of citrate/malate metabolism